MPSVIEVDVSDLDFDLQNPRNEPQQSQREALEKMLLDEPKKSATLAEHIVSNGPNPLDLIAVIKSDGKKYIVLEGNRRTAVLKALTKPVLLDGFENVHGAAPSIRKLKQLASASIVKDLKKVDVVLFDDREEANVWIALKHTGENNGAGTVVWDGIQAARFRKGDAALALLEYGKAKNWFTDEKLNSRGSFPISTLNRLISDPDVRKSLGLEFISGRLESLIPPEQLAKGVKRIVSDLADGKVTVTNLKLKSDRARYIKELPPRDKPDLANQVDSWPLDANAARAQAASNTKARPRATSTSRTTLIPSHFTVMTSVDSPRLNYIYRELKKIRVDTSPNAVAVLFRAFIELSLDDFIHREKVNINIKHKDQAKLSDKVTAAVDHLKTSKRLTVSTAHTILKLASNAPEHKSQAASITTLHAFVHNRFSIPLPSELKQIWDTVEVFMREITHVPN